MNGLLSQFEEERFGQRTFAQRGLQQLTSQVALPPEKFAPIGIYADLYGYHEEHFCFRYVNYQVFCEYRCPEMYDVVVRRVDAHAGWIDNLQVLVWNRNTNESKVIHVGQSYENEIRIPVYTQFGEPPCIPSKDPLSFVPVPRTHMSASACQRIHLETFNHKFQSNIQDIPQDLFAIGIDQENKAYIYNTNYKTYDDIAVVIQHLVHITISRQLGPLYFVISSQDGYFEKMYYDASRNDVPIYHRCKDIVCQSSQKSFPNTLNVVDRHYFYHNMYNSFRSFHRGIPFDEKKSMLVFGGQDRGTKHNFLVNRTIEMSPRNYFKSQIAPQYPWIACSSDELWIDRRDMIHYKYILDVDGIASTWDATAWKLNSGSVIFKSQSAWEQWFYGQRTEEGLQQRTTTEGVKRPVSFGFLPGIHYIEIKDDFSDIEEKFRWCEAHPEECIAMITRCLDLFQHVYRYDHICNHSEQILRQIKTSFVTTMPALPSTRRWINRIFYINLDHRLDRRTHIEDQLLPCNVHTLTERFPGIVHEYDDVGLQRAQELIHRGMYKDIAHSKGIIGCTKSHMEIYRMAKQRNYKYVMILEDDFTLLVLPEEFHGAIENMFVDMEDNFDVCMLSYKLIAGEPVPEKPYLTRVQEAQTASGYIVNVSYVDTLIQLYETTLPMLEQTGEHWKYANDQAWKILQTSDRWYCFTHRLGKQMDSYSDNAGAFMNYAF